MWTGVSPDQLVAAAGEEGGLGGVPASSMALSYAARAW